MSEMSYPVNDEVIVHAGETIYHTDEWWKAAVLNSHDNKQIGVAIYLWHKNEAWVQKSKYQVRTQEAWESDQSLVDRYMDDRGENIANQNAFPVNDYYQISNGETVFKTEDWWKAVVKIDQKGTYETEEVIIYLWQKVSDDWRRREKYTIKSESGWNRDRQAVNDLLLKNENGVEAHSEEKSSNDSRHDENVRPSFSGDGTDSTTVDSGSLLGDIQEEFKRKHIGDRT
jgi:hypothetical protein